MLKNKSSSLRNLNKLGINLALASTAQANVAAEEIASLFIESFEKAPEFESNKSQYLDFVSKLANFKNLEDFQANLEPWSKPNKKWELPNEICLFLDDDMENLFVFSKTNPLWPSEGELIHTILSDNSFFDTNSDFEDLNESDSFLALRKCDLWLFILSNYELKSYVIHTPSIETFGMPDSATTTGAKQLLSSMGFLFSPENNGIGCPLRIDNSSGDCSTAIGIELIRK